MSDGDWPPIGRAFPMFGTGRMDIDSGLLGKREKTVELFQPFRPQASGVRVEGMKREENSHTIDAQLFHAGEIFACGFSVELFPNLRRPSGAGPIIIQAERNVRFALLCD